MNEITTKIQSMTAGQVWEVIWSLKDKTDDASDLIFCEALEALETKVSEEKYIELMGKL